MRLVDSTFAPKGFEGFSFRNDDRKLDDKEVLSTDGKLDDEGRSEFKVEMPAGAPVPSSLEAVITARVQEQGGRGVAAMQRLQVHPYPSYIGVRRAGGKPGEEGFADPGKPAGFEYVVVSPEGKEVPARRTAGRPLRGPLEHGAAQDGQPAAGGMRRRAIRC